RLVVCFFLAIDQIAQSGLSSLKVIYYSAQLFSANIADSHTWVIEVTSMPHVFGWGFVQGYVNGNPCKGIRKFTLLDRDVYIPDEDYLAAYECAAQRSWWPWKFHTFAPRAKATYWIGGS
ncbi:hypothetical protein SAMN03159353_10341, partial [Cedecea sp. NFIX57]